MFLLKISIYLHPFNRFTCAPFKNMTLFHRSEVQNEPDRENRYKNCSFSGRQVQYCTLSGREVQTCTYSEKEVHNCNLQERGVEIQNTALDTKLYTRSGGTITPSLIKSGVRGVCRGAVTMKQYDSCQAGIVKF